MKQLNVSFGSKRQQETACELKVGHTKLVLIYLGKAACRQFEEEGRGAPARRVTQPLSDVGRCTEGIITSFITSLKPASSGHWL